MEAVDSAVGPEVEDDDLTAEIGDGERSRGIEPSQFCREVGSPYGSAESTAPGFSHRSLHSLVPRIDARMDTEYNDYNPRPTTDHPARGTP
jgi:hypothetical protein